MCFHSAQNKEKMPPVEDVKTDPQDAPMRSSIIGIIYPPPEVRSILENAFCEENLLLSLRSLAFFSPV